MKHNLKTTAFGFEHNPHILSRGRMGRQIAHRIWSQSWSMSAQGWIGTHYNRSIMSKSWNDECCKNRSFIELDSQTILSMFRPAKQSLSF